MAKLTKLFEPSRIGQMEIKNRIVLSPMGNRKVAVGGSMTKPAIDYYVERAKGGVGFIIAGAHCILQEASGEGSALIHDDKYIPSLKELSQAVHQYETKISVQLHHPGKTLLSEQLRRGKEGEKIDAIAPSAIPYVKYGVAAKEATKEDLSRVIRGFAEAARRVKEAGFDAVSIHGGHGYLISSFLSPFTNRRTDEYGGSRENRARFACEVIAAIREKVGPDFPIILRFSGSDFLEGGITLEDSCHQAPLFVEAGADALDVSASAAETTEWQFLGYLWPYGAIVYLAEAIKKVVNVPVITVGKIVDPLHAESILKEGKADFVALGRALLADPDWPNKAREGRLDDIRHCIYCNNCVYHQGLFIFGGSDASASFAHPACTVNPELHREKGFEITPTSSPKKVMVIGGGLAGMEAARVLAERGHQVSLYEKSDRLGGQWNIVVQQPGKENWAEVSQRLVDGLHKAGVKVTLNKEITRDFVEKEKPDTVIVATGAVPLKLPIPGIDNKNVVQAADVFTKKAQVGQRVVVVGGRTEGMEVTNLLAEQDKEVSLVTRSELGGTGSNRMDKDLYHTLRNRFASQGIAIFPRSPLYEIRENGVYIDDTHELLFLPADTIVLAVGKRSESQLVAELEGMVPEIHNIGDSVEPRDALYAIREGAEIGRKI